MLVTGMILPWLMVIHVLESTLFWNLLAAGLTSIGIMAYIIGFVFNTFVDRAD
jgi:putative flippase GtrA